MNEDLIHWLEANGFTQEDLKINKEDDIVVIVDGVVSDTGSKFYDEIPLVAEFQTEKNKNFIKRQC